MKIAFLIISEQFAGAENVVRELSAKISSDHDVTIICNKQIEQYYKRNSKVKLFVLPYSLPNKKLLRTFSYLRYAFKLRQHLRDANYDLINPILLSSILVFRWSLSIDKCRYVLVLQGGEIKHFNDEKSLIYKILIKPSVAKVMLKADKLITISDWQVKKLNKTYMRNLIKIPNGVDVQKFKPSEVKKDGNKVIAFYAGRLIDIKGVNELLAAAKKLPNIEFWFAGAGTLSEKIQGPNIKYLGYKNSNELARIYNKATFCIFPSYHEPFALVGLEAMACGKPIICTPKGFTEYAVDGLNSLVVKPKNVPELKKAIEKLGTDPDLCKRLGANARKTAIEYDWSKIAKQYMDVFEEVGGKHE